MPPRNPPLAILALMGAFASSLHAESMTNAASSPDAASIAKFRGDRAAAVSLTFDDGLGNQNDVAVPLLHENGLKASFFIIPGRTPETDQEAALKKPGDLGGISWTRLKELSAEGHEIANHTWMHISFLIRQPDGHKVDIDPAKIEDEIRRAGDAIKGRLGFLPFSCATPGDVSDEAIRATVHKYHPAFRDRLIERFGDWPPTGKTFTTEKANAIVEGHITQGDQMVWMVHGITEGYNAQSGPEVLGNHLKYLKNRQDVVWVDTYGSVSRYVMERDAAKLVATPSGNGLIFSLQCPLDSKLFGDPLTVVIPAPGVVKAEAKRSGSGMMLPVTIRGGKILVDAVPSSDPVVVRWSGAKG